MNKTIEKATPMANTAPGRRSTSRKRFPAKFITVIEILPHQQLRIALGRFTAAQPPIGFSVEFTPDPTPSRTATTHVVSTGTPEHYDLTLHLANHGTRILVATIRQL